MKLKDLLNVIHDTTRICIIDNKDFLETWTGFEPANTGFADQCFRPTSPPSLWAG